MKRLGLAATGDQAAARFALSSYNPAIFVLKLPAVPMRLFTYMTLAPRAYGTLITRRAGAAPDMMKNIRASTMAP